MKQLIHALTEIIGPSSCEELVEDYIEKILRKNRKLEIKRDVMGNLIARRKGSGKKIMLAAHMDEIGFIVKHIDKNGYLRFAVVGGIFNHNIIENHVKFTNGIEGVIGIESKTFNLKEIPTIEKMFIDIGAKNKSEAEKLVSIGSTAGMKATFVDMGKRISTKTLDDRVGCAMLIELALKEIKGNNDIYFVFTTQEEVGLRGAKTSAFEISPDFAIAVDVTDTGDTPESNVMEVSLGNGPAIKVMDSGMIVRKSVIDFMKETAEKNKIPYQLEILIGGSTDAMIIQTNKDGVLAGVISIPTRYIHSQAEMCDIDDVKNGIILIKKIKEINLTKREF